MKKISTLVAAGILSCLLASSAFGSTVTINLNTTSPFAKPGTCVAFNLHTTGGIYVGSYTLQILKDTTFTFGKDQPLTGKEYLLTATPYGCKDGHANTDSDTWTYMSNPISFIDASSSATAVFPDGFMQKKSI